MCKKPSDTERELNSSIPLDLMEHVLKGMNVGPLHSHLACSFIYCLMAPFGPAASTCILMWGSVLEASSERTPKSVLRLQITTVSLSEAVPRSSRHPRREEEPAVTPVVSF